MTATTAPKAGTRRVRYADDSFRYVGQVRQGARVVTECGHEHLNRDVTTQTSGVSARDCAERIISGAHRQRRADDHAARYRSAVRPATYGRKAADLARADAEARAEAFLAAVDAVRALLDPADIDLRTAAEVAAPYRLPLL